MAKTKRQVFYSFHFDNDVMRVQQIRNIGAFEGNEPASSNEWESIRRTGDAAIKKWISDNMSYRSCVIVLAGAETSRRPWVQYEIQKAWSDKKGLFGIHIHNLNCPRRGRSLVGRNPFEQFTIDSGTKRMSTVVPCYNPSVGDAYGDISRNIAGWIESALTAATQR